MGTDMPTPDDFRISRVVEVRFRDLDAMGHVNNAAYFTYFEIAREGYARALGHCPDDERDPRLLYPFILLETSCRFLAAAGMSDRLRVHIRAGALGTKSFRFEYLITREGDGAAIASGASTQVGFDYAAGRTRILADDLVERFEAVEQRPLR